MKINGREFWFQIASDVVRNGIGVELNELKDGKNIFVAEIFRNDSKKQIEFCSTETELPYEVILKLQQIFEMDISKKFDD